MQGETEVFLSPRILRCLFGAGPGSMTSYDQQLYTSVQLSVTARCRYILAQEEGECWPLNADVKIDNASVMAFPSFRRALRLRYQRLCIFIHPTHPLKRANSDVPENKSSIKSLASTGNPIPRGGIHTYAIHNTCQNRNSCGTTAKK
jgi:hypothetical protein